jgi:hypothetical protein|tara:strand:- start:3132 stop:3863 length:732 start_codon:yes stop_codon:yes gene_type:complete
MSLFNTNGLTDALAYGTLSEILGLGNSTDGMSRKNRYEVTLYPPTGARGSRGNTSNVFSKIMGDLLGDGTVRATGLRCESISMPGRNMDSTPDTNIYGPEREIVTGYSFGDINAIFQCSSDMREKKYWETWQRLTYNPKTFDIGYYNDYVGTVDIHTLDEQERRRYGVRLVEAWPKTIGAQSLGYADNNTYQTVDITIAYRYWVNLTDESSEPRSLGSRIAERAVNTVTRRITSQIPSVIRRL